MLNDCVTCSVCFWSADLYLFPADIQGVGLYNFRPTVRPVPLEIHIQGFPGKHYCPRMATMNRPTFKGGSAIPLESTPSASGQILLAPE